MRYGGVVKKGRTQMMVIDGRPNTGAPVVPVLHTPHDFKEKIDAVIKQAGKNWGDADRQGVTFIEK